MNFVYPIREPKQVARITELLSKHYSQLHADAWVIGCNTGLRVSDLLSLTKQQVVEGAIRTKASKTNKVSITKLGNKALEAVQRRVEQSPNDYLFVSTSARNSSEKPLNRSSLSRALKDIGELLGLEGGLSSHSMRKTYGYAIYRAEGLAEAQNALGHSSSGTTLDYLALGQEKANNAIVALDLG